MLLREALNDEITGKEVLAEIGVHKMTPELALKVIGTRTDITNV